jgi:hypothetical protein
MLAFFFLPEMGELKKSNRCKQRDNILSTKSQNPLDKTLIPNPLPSLELSSVCHYQNKLELKVSSGFGMQYQGLYRLNAGGNIITC